MHQASILGESFSDAKAYGWAVPEGGIPHKWETMVGAIQDHIGSLNWGYKVQLRDKKVEYINGLGKLLDAHTVEATKRNKSKQVMTAETIVIAVGGRPRYLDVPGDKELCITSDDLFSLPTPPGKTLLVGASYTALESAGFLNALGYTVHVMLMDYNSVPTTVFTPLEYGSVGLTEEEALERYGEANVEVYM
ncbi:thioredoxin reductase TR1 [Haematococcus lacustris]|uniref:thioredoxin-disulfide reductase (NADPH) n=1 Tax=Haematococcus lacustris TaxID=44745 RepID=A0A699ZPG1_HAELA|nr:thioredoxin reductase TR1 [Haematococcus lacustris]